MVLRTQSAGRLLFVVAMTALLMAAKPAASEPATGNPTAGKTANAKPAGVEPPAAKILSGLPLPRFVSLKSDKVNVRGGPTKDHEVTWIFTRAGLPVEVTAEFENWRRIRDWEGAEGWVYHSLLSGRRTAMVRASPKAKDTLLAIRDKADAQTAITARLQPGVVAMVKKCTGAWCRIAGGGYDGWIEQERLFGVYPNEKVE